MVAAETHSVGMFLRIPTLQYLPGKKTKTELTIAVPKPTELKRLEGMTSARKLQGKAGTVTTKRNMEALNSGWGSGGIKGFGAGEK